MTRMVRLDQAQNLNKGPGAYMPCVDHTIAATKKIWPLVLTEADGSPSRRAVITCARQGLHFGQIKLKTRKGAHMQEGGSQPSPLFLFMHTLIDSPHAYGILQCNLQKTRWTVDSCDLKKVDMTAAPKDAPTLIHCSERHTGSSGMTLPEGTCPRRTSLARCFLFDMAEKVKRRRPQVRLSRETVGAARVTSRHCSTL